MRAIDRLLIQKKTDHRPPNIVFRNIPATPVKRNETAWPNNQTRQGSQDQRKTKTTETRIQATNPSEQSCEKKKKRKTKQRTRNSLVKREEDFLF